MNFGSTVCVSSACTWHCFPANQQMFLVRCCSFCAPVLPLIPKYICLFPHMMFFPLELLTRLTELCSHLCEHWCPVAWTGSRHSVARATVPKCCAIFSHELFHIQYLRCLLPSLILGRLLKKEDKALNSKRFGETQGARVST